MANKDYAGLGAEKLSNAKVEELLDRGHDPRGFVVAHEVTEPGSHFAKAPGYAEGRVIAVGEPVPHGLAVADEWMAPADAPAEPAAE